MKGIKAKVWGGLLAGGIIGPHFFKNHAGENVTVNGDRYHVMITDYLMPEIETCDLGDICSQQDGATSDSSHQSMDLLREHFGEQIISRQTLEQNITRIIRHK